MSEFIVDPSTISFQEIRKKFEAYIASRPDAERWSQFFASSTGQISIELASGFGAFLLLDSVLSRRENFLQFAQTRGGVVAGGQVQGYSAFRGRNAILTLTFTPSSSGVYNKFDAIGNVSGYPISILDSIVYNAGTPITVDCVAGDFLEETQTAPNDGINKFRFTKKRVSDDIRMSIDGTEVPFSTDILQLLEDQFYVQANPVGSIDVAYLNDVDAPTRYLSGSEIKLEYFELRDITFNVSQVVLDETEGTLDNVVLKQIYQSPEDIESIRIKAPLENETKFTIRGRNDYSKLLLLSNPDFVAAGGRDTAVAAEVEIFALKDDLSVLSQAEKDAFLDSVRVTPRTFGVRPPFVIDPEPYFLELSVSLCLNVGQVGDPNALVRTTLATYEKNLATPEEEQSIDFKEVEANLQSDALVQTARIEITTSTWVLLNAYVRGKHVVPTVSTGFIYEALEYVRYSGGTEPAWPSPVPLPPPQNGFTYGQTIDDNDLQWIAVAKDETAQDWQADTVYRVGDKVKSSEPDASFVVAQYYHNSETATPQATASATEQSVTFTADNPGSIGNSISLVFDGLQDIDTVVGGWNSANPTNTVSHDGTGTDVLTSATVTLSGGIDADTNEPTWPEPVDPSQADERIFVSDNQILWLMVNLEGTPPAWTPGTRFVTGDTVVPSAPTGNQNNIMFQMVSFIGKSGSSEPTFPTTFADTVIDGEVTWVARNILKPGSNLISASPEAIENNEYFLITESVSVE